VKQVLVVAPHPDDETLGCGGTLLRHKAAGDALHWVIVTEMRPELGYAPAQITRRQSEIKAVADAYGFSSVTALGFPAARLDAEPKRNVVARIGEVFTRQKPEVVYLPFPGDAHTDHQVSFESAMACCKWFRIPSIQRVLSYETLSETDASLDPRAACFRPNVFVDIAEFLDGKLSILDLYAGETAPFPFPRSERAVRSLADVRGAASGATAAEAFMLLKEKL
jgi:LmbE family N-acetylglucosaminyl deacetylase